MRAVWNAHSRRLVSLILEWFPKSRALRISPPYQL
jgi:hypothetical protein